MWNKRLFFLNREGEGPFPVPPVAADASNDSPTASVGEKKEPVPDAEKGSQHAGETRVEDVPDQDAQGGVRRAEAVTLVWSKKSLILMYGSIFLLAFINSLQQQITSNLGPFVVSDFQLHSLIPAVAIAAQILNGVLHLPIAKIIDGWGRHQGFALMVSIGILGLILKASCQNVQTFAAAEVFYQVGLGGAMYVVEVIVADTSTFKNRALAFAFNASPYIATTWAGPEAAASFLRTSGWRWGFGTFAIVFPFVAAPIFVILLLNEKKAERQGLIKQKIAHGRGFAENIKFHIIDYDVLGILLLCGGLVLFLLPFTLVAYARDQWRSGSMIAMLVVGFVLLIAFFVYERFFAPKGFIPFRLLTSPTVVGAGLLIATLFIAFYCWDGYYTSYLMVVHNLSIQHAGYVANIYSIGACLWAIVVGLLIRVSGRYKWLAWCAIPVAILGGGLMIHFRQPDTDIGYVVMCQIFIAFAGGTMVICEQMAAMAVSQHQDIAAVLALLFMFAQVGGAIGSSVSGAIWTNTIPGKLLEYLPEETKPAAAQIYGSIVVQLSFPVGSPVRTAVQMAYGEAQKRMCIAGTAILGTAFLWVAMWKDVHVNDVHQSKGRLF